jgi:hypothetical protein
MFLYKILLDCKKSNKNNKRNWIWKKREREKRNHHLVCIYIFQINNKIDLNFWRMLLARRYIYESFKSNLIILFFRSLKFSLYYWGDLKKWKFSLSLLFYQMHLFAPISIKMEMIKKNRRTKRGVVYYIL